MLLNTSTQFFNEHKIIFGYFGLIIYVIYMIILYFLIYKNLWKREKTFISIFHPVVIIVLIILSFYLLFWSLKTIWVCEDFHQLFGMPYKQQIFLLKKKKIFLFLRKILFTKLFYFNAFSHVLASICLKFIVLEKSIVFVKPVKKNIIVYNAEYAKTLLKQYNVIIGKTQVHERICFIDKFIIFVSLFCYICWFYTSKKYVVTFILSLFAILILCS